MFRIEGHVERNEIVLRGVERQLDQAPATDEIQFSKHALARLHSRGLTIDDHEIGRLTDAVDQLEARGSKEALVLLDDRAYVVGVPKRTVITAMPRAMALGQIFTQIDSTFIGA